jgi:hypothetical protein
MFRRWGKRLLRLVLFGLSVFVGLELALRVLQPSSLDYYRKLKLLHVYHPEYLVGLDPGADYYLRHNNGLWEGRFTINSLGYRGSVEPQPGEAVLGCLGDSLVMGFGVSDDQTFCRLLDGVELSGRNFRTQNLGVDAFGSVGYAARLDEAVEKLPGLETILLFISPNDFTLPQELRDRGISPDDELAIARELNPEFHQAFRIQFELTRYFFSLHAAAVAVQQLRLRAALYEKSMRRDLVEMGLLTYDPVVDGDIAADRRGPFNYLRASFYRPMPEPLCGAPAAPSSNDDLPASGHVTPRQPVAAPLCPQPVPPQMRCAAAPPADEDLAPLPEITSRAYDRMIHTSRENGIRLVVVFLPVQMETLYCEMNGQYSPFFEHGLRARRYFRSRGVETIDLRPYTGEMCGEFEPGAAGPARSLGVTDFIIQGDGHLTVAGNRWAARALRRELEKLAGQHAF